MTYAHDFYLTDFDEVSAGANWNWPHVIQEQRWDEWYDDRLNTLLAGSPTTDNGLAYPRLIGPNYNAFNGFKLIADTYRIGMGAELPTVERGAAEVTELENFKSELKFFFMEWSKKSRAVMYSQDYFEINGVSSGGVHFVSPNVTSYFPVYSKFNPREIVGHVLAFPYREKQVLQTSQFPDRLRVVKFSNVPGFERNTVEVFTFSGSQIGERLSFEDGIVRDFFYLNTRDPQYPIVEDTVREINIRLAVLQLANNRSIPHFVLPSSLDIDARRLNREQGTILQIDEDDIKPQFTEYKAGVDMQLESLTYAQQRFYALTGLTAVLLGETHTQAESSAAREDLLIRPQTRIVDARRIMEEQNGMPRFLSNSFGWQRGQVRFYWNNPPFSSISMLMGQPAQNGDDDGNDGDSGPTDNPAE